MTKALSFALAVLFHPLPVTSLSAFVNADHSVTLDWTLPADPTVVGITIFRDRLDSGETVVYVIDGAVGTYTDVTAIPHEGYRYWVHTRDAEGDLSEGVWVQVGSGSCDCDGSDWWCVVTSVSSAPAPWSLLAAAALLALATLHPRGHGAHGDAARSQ